MSSFTEHTFTSPFRNFTREEWKRLNGQLNHSLKERDLDKLHALGEPLTLAEIEEIYVPLVHLLEVHIDQFQELHAKSNVFFKRNHQKLPFIIGIAGSVAAGKSTTARVLRKVLSLLPSEPKVELVTTDGFLYPNKELIKRNILNRKGFPESYDTKKLLQFLSDIKSGKSQVSAPVYSHLEYDILPREKLTINQPDILIIEGINVLQVNTRKNGVFVSDFFDYSIYVDADEKDIVNWYIDRFESLRDTAFQNSASYFHKYANLDSDQSIDKARQIWDEINRPNLHENILPTRYRADLILKKSAQHFVKKIKVRKI